MKVRELIYLLKGYDPEMTVHTAYDFGDYWNTQVAPKVGQVEPAQVAWSEYHCMPRIVEREDDDQDAYDAKTLETVLVIG